MEKTFLPTTTVDTITLFENGLVSFFSQGNIVFATKWTSVPELYLLSTLSEPTIQFRRADGSQFNLNVRNLQQINHKTGTLTYTPLPPVYSNNQQVTTRAIELYNDLIFYVFRACCPCDVGEAGGGTVTSVNAEVAVGVNAVSFSGVPFTDFGTILLNFDGTTNEIVQGDGTLGFRQKRVQWVWDDEIIQPYTADTQVVRFAGSGIAGVTAGTYIDGNPCINIEVDGGGGGTPTWQEVTTAGNTTTDSIFVNFGGGDSFFMVNPTARYIGLGDVSSVYNNTFLNIDDVSKFVSGYAEQGYYLDGGALKMPQYGGGAITGTAVSYLGVDATGKVLNVSAPSSTNIYNTDGTLTGDRHLAGGGHSLTFDGISDIYFEANSSIEYFVESGGSQSDLFMNHLTAQFNTSGGTKSAGLSLDSALGYTASLFVNDTSGGGHETKIVFKSDGVFLFTPNVFNDTAVAGQFLKLVDLVTGEVEFADVPSSTNIYNSDGTLTGRRAVNGGGYLLGFENTSDFYASSTNTQQLLLTDGSTYTNQYSSNPNGFVISASALGDGGRVSVDTLNQVALLVYSSSDLGYYASPTGLKMKTSGVNTATVSVGYVATLNNIDGTFEWQAAAGGLPSQTGNAGKYLKTDGTSPSWEALSGNVSAFTNDAGYLTSASLTGYVPYTGATADVDLGTHILNAQSIHAKGTGGNGHVGLKHQSANATAGGSESVIFADSNGNLKWKNDGLSYYTLVANAITADRSYTLPDASGTIALTSDLSGYVPTSRTLTINGTALDLSANRSWTVGDLRASNNLSDLANAATARTNLGLGTAATQNSTAFAQVANNLSDLANAATARTNLGLGAAATQPYTENQSSASLGATGFSSKTSDTIYWTRIGKLYTCYVNIQGTSNATTLTFPLPNSATAATGQIIHAGYITNGGASSSNPTGTIQLSTGSNTATCFRDANLNTWTNTGGKAFIMTFTFFAQ